MRQRSIFVVSSGWVMTGYERADSSDHKLTVDDASCIRRWGTTGGLGQLAQQGPTKDTKLEFCGTVSINRHHLLMTIECAKWP